MNSAKHYFVGHLLLKDLGGTRTGGKMKWIQEQKKNEAEKEEEGSELGGWWERERKKWYNVKVWGREMKNRREDLLLQGAHSVPRSYRQMSSQYLFEPQCRNHFRGMRKSCIRAEKLPWAYRSLSTFILIQRWCQESIKSILIDDICITFESAWRRPGQVVTRVKIPNTQMLHSIFVCYLVLFDILWIIHFAVKILLKILFILASLHCAQLSL